MQDILPLLGTIGQYGSIVTVLIIAFKFADITRTVTGLEKSIGTLKAEFKTQIEEALRPIRADIAAVEKRMADNLAVLKSEIDAIQVRLSVVETEYQTKEEFFRTFSGWREEFRALNQRIDRIIERSSRLRTRRDDDGLGPGSDT